jgi:hypothetical protein
MSKNRSLVLFVKKHQILFSVLSFVFIQLPPYIESVWSLIEHFNTTTSTASGTNAMNLSWLYWVTVPVGLVLFGVVIWLSNKTVLTDIEKIMVTDLITATNILDDKLNSSFNNLILKENNKVKLFQEILDSSEFRESWDRWSKQRAEINLVSPELSEKIRLLIYIQQTGYSFLLKDWKISELPKFEKSVTQITETTEALKKSIRKTIERLMR